MGDHTTYLALKSCTGFERFHSEGLYRKMLVQTKGWYGDSCLAFPFHREELSPNPKWVT